MKVVDKEEVFIEVLKGTTREVDFNQVIAKQKKLIDELKRMTGNKADKTDQAFFNKQEQRLEELQDIIRNWIWEAFEDDSEVISKTAYWGELNKNYRVKVYVEKL